MEDLIFSRAEKTHSPPPRWSSHSDHALLWTSSTLANNVLRNAFPRVVDSLPRWLPVGPASTDSCACVSPPLEWGPDSVLQTEYPKRWSILCKVVLQRQATLSLAHAEEASCPVVTCPMKRFRGQRTEGSLQPTARGPSAPADGHRRELEADPPPLSLKVMAAPTDTLFHCTTDPEPVDPTELSLDS